MGQNRAWLNSSPNSIACYMLSIQQTHIRALATFYCREVPCSRNVTNPGWGAHSTTKYSHWLHLFPGAIHFLCTDGMSGTKERELNFPAELVEIERAIIFLLTLYVMYWCHVRENKGQGAFSAQSKCLAWTIRVFSKYLSPSAFKISYCYKTPLLHLHWLLSSVSTNRLNLMPNYQMLRKRLHEWAWVNTWEARNIDFRLGMMQSACLKEGFWTRVPRLQGWPENQNRNNQRFSA